MTYTEPYLIAVMSGLYPCDIQGVNQLIQSDPIPVAREEEELN